ncbi:MAG TPA: F0F1 ATP synthase subunit delta [Propionibacteriaceae bacterium]|nr:F0F1 ATP synthase subunit delta [Propionibacteriaceae bacterium]
MTSIAVSQADETRRGLLDRVVGLDAVEPGTSADLFAALDAIAGSSALRRAVTDPGRRDEQKVAIVRQLFGGRVGAQALSVLEAAVSVRWNSASALFDALERQGVRAALATALTRGALDEVIDALFRFDRIVHADGELQAGLEDERVPVGVRESLVDRLLADKTDPVTVALAKRALSQRSRSFFHALESMLGVAAELRDRAVAQVTVARPLDDDQEARLRAALSKALGRAVDLQVIVDPEVIGGARVVLGDHVIEGTIQQKLIQISRMFS